MKKSMMTLAAVLCCAMTMMAEPVSPTTARQAAAQFLQHKGTTLKSEAMRAPHRAMGQAADDESVTEASPYYVFNASNDKGFVIVSGDDCVGDDLVLGYTAQGCFHADAVPATLQGWLDDMAERIALASRQGMRARAVTTHDNIAPLVTAEWGQGENTYSPAFPYNAFCPVLDGALCLTGCMATALSQVLYYYRWPQGPIDGELPAYSMVDGRFVEALPATTFDWDNMLDHYRQPTTEAQQTAVATLMRYCGQVVQMDYTPWVSNGLFFDTDILVNQFGYDQGVFLAKSEEYTVSGWDELIYQELKEGRPMVYMGFSTGGGHAFVVDGSEVQEGSGYYHVNWGWDGRGNGFYKINLLNPDLSGAGGSTTKDGYCRGQQALIGLQPAQSALDNYGRYLASYSWAENEEGYPRYSVVANTSYRPGIFAVAMAERNSDGTIDYDRILAEQTMPFSGYSFAGSQNNTESGLGELFLPENLTENLTAGHHELVFVNREVGTDAPWHPIFGPNSYVEINVDEEGHPVDTLYHPLPQLTASSRYFVLNGLKQRGLREDVSAKITNNSDDDFIGPVFLRIYYKEGNTLQYLAANFRTGIMIEAHGTTDLELNCTFPQSGDYVMVLTRGSEDLAGLSASALKQTDGYICHKTVTIDDLSFVLQDVAYSVNTDDSSNPPSSFEFLVYNGTPMDYNAYMMMRLFKLNDEGYYDEYLFADASYLYCPLTVGARAQQRAKIWAPEVLEAGEYAVQLYIANDFHSNMYNDYFTFAGGLLTVTDPTGIAAVKNGSSPLDDVIYDVQGRRVADSQSLNKGIYIRNGKKFFVK